MDYLSDLLSRTDLQYVTEYILSGNSLAVPEVGTAAERLDAAEAEFWRLARTVGDENFAERLYRCCAVCEGVYAELGMCAGASLTARLLCGGTAREV